MTHYLESIIDAAMTYILMYCFESIIIKHIFEASICQIEFCLKPGPTCDMSMQDDLAASSV